jgi:hypothetical protein
MSPYRNLFVVPSETTPFRIRVKELLGDKGLHILCLVGVGLIWGGTLLFVGVGLMVPATIRTLIWAYALSLVLGVFLGVSSRVIALGWQGYWNED